VTRVADVEIRQFWMKKLKEISFSSFRIEHVPYMKKMKTDEAKNKVFKPHECIRYLTLYSITHKFYGLFIIFFGIIKSFIVNFFWLSYRLTSSK
jgi:hypothetical protein